MMEALEISPHSTSSETVNVSINGRNASQHSVSCELLLNSSACLWNTSDKIVDQESVEDASQKVYWALMMIPLPLVAVVGNILVILSVYKERSLQTATNYFIVSLAFADLLVAAVVMPFAVYVLVNVDWELSDTLCDFYIAVDVTCSTASIFNLVAISIDRFIAVTQPIKYSKHKNNKRVFLTIAIVWLVSAAIGSPIVLGLNTSPERIPNLCVFYNSDFIIYSSLSSFYIPCIVMVYLYYKIFKAIHERAKKAIGHKPLAGATRTGLVIENVAQTETLRSEVKGESERYREQLPVLLETDEVNQQEEVVDDAGNSNGDEEDDENPDGSPDHVTAGCHVIQNEAAGQFLLNDVQQENARSASNSVAVALADPCAAREQEEETQFCVQNPHTDSPSRSSEPKPNSSEVSSRQNGTPNFPKDRSIPAMTITATTTFSTSHRCENLSPSFLEKKKSRFSLVRHQKSSKKKREKNAARRERKATKTLAIVLGMFLMCWVPFFTCNILDAICIKLQSDECRPGVTAFLLTTWLGYINSCVNPVIYTIFNMEFRKAFKKLLLEPCQ